MATSISKNFDVETPMRELAEKRKIFGFTSNKFGRILIINKEVYGNMLRNNDTLRDANGLNDNFSKLTDKEIETIRKLKKSKIKAPFGTPKDDIKELEEKLLKERIKLKKESDDIYISKVSKLRNFMTYFLDGKIEDKKTDLNNEVLEKLKKIKITSTDTVIKEKDNEIEKLKKELLETKKLKK